MSYTTTEQALAAQLDAIAGYSTAAGTGNVTRGNYRVLERGVGSAAIIEYGGFDQERTEISGGHEVQWRFDVTIFYRWGDEFTAAPGLGIMRQDIIDRINEYPLLGTTGIFDAMVVSGDPAPQEINVGAVKFDMEILRCHATEEVSVSYAE